MSKKTYWSTLLAFIMLTLSAHAQSGDKGEVVDEHGIITSPAAGITKNFTRSGYSYYSQNQQVAVTSQGGTVTIVECSDGTIYIKDPLAMNPAETWVKGTKSGNTVTVPAKQPIFYSYNYGTTASLRWGMKTPSGNYQVADSHADAFTFTVNGNTITLEGTSANFFMGQFWDDDDTFTRYGDYGTVWTSLDVPSQIDELPYTPSFSSQSDQLSFTIINANNDDGIWRFNSNGYAEYKYSNANPGDDWLITPAIKLEAGKAYRLAFETWGSYYEERLEVKMGADKTVEAMNTSVIPSTDVLWKEDDIKTLENKFITVSADGYYYFGLHAISDANQYLLHVNHLIVEVSADLNAPSKVTDLRVVPAVNKLEATISFKTPTTSVAGNPLTENLTKIEILRGDETIKTFENVALGTELSYVDADPALKVGSYSYQVIAYNAAGKGITSDPVTAYISNVAEVPYTADLSSKDVFDMFQVIDNNEDHATWKWTDAGYFAFCEHHDNHAADDYLVSQPVRLEAGKQYVFTANLNAFHDENEERFEVVYGFAPTVSSMKMKLIEPTVITSVYAEDYQKVFTVPVTGNYYFGIHAISDKNKYFLVAHGLSVAESTETTGVLFSRDNQEKSDNIYTIDGKLIHRQDNSLKGQKGVFIINNKKVLLKD